MRFVPWWTAPPAIVAESLVAVPDPLLTALRPGPLSFGAAVAASLARSLSPAEDDAPPPQWLLPQQRRSFRRVLAALRRHRGAVLADPVGSGKTYVALAVAASFNRGSPTACLVPATLQPQWEAIAKKLEIPLVLCSHEQVSRGRLPDQTRGLVIVDESHRFRNRQTRRYAHLARWLVGRPALLVTATPIVNQPLGSGPPASPCSPGRRPGDGWRRIATTGSGERLHSSRAGAVGGREPGHRGRPPTQDRQNQRAGS